MILEVQWQLENELKYFKIIKPCQKSKVIYTYFLS